MEMPKASKEHEWLKQFVGKWTMTSECDMGPDQPKMETAGEETGRMLGDLWLVSEGSGKMPDGDRMTFILQLGFDPAKQKFVGSWVSSCGTNQFVYEGTLDAAGRTLTLDTIGPSFTDPGATTRYQDIMEIQPDGRRMLYSQVPGPDGKWMRFMTATYTKAR